MKAMILLCFCLIIASCSPYGFNPMGYEIKNENLDEAWKKVAAMKYIPESDDKDYWKSPTEFYADGGGDCEDFAIALVYLLGIDAEMLFVRTTTKAFHAIVHYKDMWIEPQEYEVYYKDVKFSAIVGRYPYKILMLYATYMGSKRNN